ncbi:phosphopantetheine-binding protein, partial [Streptomyces sp. NPDC056656]|uniref:phosphopantetheine-binding protein n=1 Tax=Streptomyces sp. NPDC056656 TaxID=3345895 RepID=UPI00368A72F7
GTLEHLGRLDDQVKIRGHRIEPAEIRTTLLDEADVLAAAVVVHGAGTASARLDAYVVTAPDADPAQIRQRIAGRLPAHLVPATLTRLPELPLTPNGKLDTAQLPDPLPPAEAPPTTGIPVTVEARLMAVWEDVLCVPVGPQDNFFEIGGNSLLASRLRTALHQAGFASVQLRDIYRNSSLPALADLVRTGRSGVKESS